MEEYADQSAYVVLKDHKGNFKTKFTCQIISPAQNKIGIVSKKELEKTNRALTNQIDYKQNKITVYKILYN